MAIIVVVVFVFSAILLFVHKFISFEYGSFKRISLVREKLAIVNSLPFP